MGTVFSIQCGDALLGRCWDCIAQRPLYICEFEDNLQALETATNELRQLSNDVRRTVNNQQTQDLVPLDQVQGWLSKVETTLPQATALIASGEEERQELCAAGFCSKNCKSSYIMGKRLSRTLKQVGTLKVEGAEFKEVVMNDPAKTLQSNLETLKTTRERLLALKEDVEQRIATEEGPEQKPLNQVQLWLSIVEKTMIEADELARDGPQEVMKFNKGDFSNCEFLGRVCNKLGAMDAFMSQGDFNEVTQRVPSAPNFFLQLQNDIKDLKSKTDELRALKADVLTRVKLEAGKQKEPQHQVKLWLSNAEALINEADQLVIDAPQEMEKLGKREFSNKSFMPNVRRLLNQAHILIAKGDFKQVVERALPERAVEKILDPPVGTEAIVEQVWSYLVNDQVAILGIYGVGGVGKTTILTEINNKFAKKSDDFDAIIFVVVSRDLKLEKIQEDIWKRIGYCDEAWLEKSLDDKAGEINHALQGKKFVLLLDDVWQPFNLKDIGVPTPQNGSKVLITARRSKVCKDMDAKRKIRVEPLTPPYDWNLFQKKVGHMDENIIHLARQVASKCDGLPSALITIGRAMDSRRSVGEWEHALKVLESFPSNLQGMDDEIYQCMETHVFKSLKFSYDFLPNKIIQSCFLYCSLFPSDFKILKNDLVHYWICENLCSLGEGYFNIGTLIHQDLLKEEGKYVKMDNVLRNMALWIACKCVGEGEKFFVRAGYQLPEVPESAEWEGAVRVSLMANSFKNFQAVGISCPDVVTLFLSHNPNLDSIGEAPFLSMVKLTVLDLSETVIKELPQEISRLQSVEYLNLSHTRIRELPRTLMKLRNLKYLNLDHTALLEMIPTELINNFPELRVLKMFLCRSMEYRKVEGNLLVNGDLLIQELQLLKNLDELSITIRSEYSLQKLCEKPRLLHCIRALVLQECNTGAALDISPLANAKHLNLLLMFGNTNLQKFVVDVTEVHAASGLTSNRPVYSSLEEVVVWYGNGLRELTWLILAPNLTILRVTFNDYMEAIISPETLHELHDGDGSSNFFQKLQVLELRGLPKLKSIYWKALSFPCLRQIDVYDCPKLKRLPLDSNSAIGCKVVIKGEQSWWENLEWEDDATKVAFSSSFQKI